MHWKAFKKMINVNKDDIYHADDSPGKMMAPIHALIMQLLAKGIIELKVYDTTKVGTDGLTDSHVMISLTSDFVLSDNWDGLNTT